MSEKPGQAEGVGDPPNPTGSQAKFPGLEHRETRATRPQMPSHTSHPTQAKIRLVWGTPA